MGQLFEDLRAWIAAVEEIGQLRRVEGANAESEIGAITDIYGKKMGRPALLFDRIPGYEPGFRVLSNITTAKERVALSLGLPPDTAPMDIVRFWREYAKKGEKLPPRRVKDGPVLQHIDQGEDVNLNKFPGVVWHELDGHPYIGTGCAVIIKDPDSDWVNVGAYRVALHDEKTTGLMISPGHQGHTLLQKYWERGEAAPVAVSLGGDPLLYLVGGINIPEGVSEYDVAGGIRGQAYDVVLGPYTGLPVPATAEIVIEGEVPPDERWDEGPFGEWTGYYAGGRRPVPIIRVRSVLYRDDPIICGVTPRVPPSDDTYYCTFLNAAEVWNQLELAGIPGVTGVWAQEAGGSRMWLTVSIKQMYPGHAKQAGIVASQCFAGNYANRWVVVVDDDIDVSDLDAVVWALCTRVDPKEDVEILKKTLSTALDPMSYPREKPAFNSRLVIDACRPWERLDSFPPVADISPELEQQTREKFPELFKFD